MQTETLLYIILAGIIALSLALFQYVYKSKKRTKVTLLLTFLRFTTLFAVFLLLINPKFDKTTYYNEKPHLVVAVDNSESIRFLDQHQNTIDLVALLKASEELNDQFNVEFYSFGKDANPLSKLTFDDKQTNPTVILDRLSQVYGNSIAPLIMVTDGNQTYGNDYEYATQKYRQPIFPIILGDTTRYTDLKIEQLNVNKYAYFKNNFPLEIIAVYNGKEDVNSQLTITSGNTTVFSQNLTFTQNQSSRIVTLSLPANSSGVHTYKAELTPLSNEKNTINNVKNFAVEVIDRKTNVAIISDMLHPDLGALKKAIESNEQREATILKPSEFINLSVDFQQAILYQPNNNFKEVYGVLENLKINTFTILGTKTKWPELNNLQSDFQQTITNQYEYYQSALNSNYTPFIVDDLNFSDFPPLQTEFGPTAFSMPIETILYKTVNGIQLQEPLLLTYEVNQKRAAVLNGEGIWRWRAQSYLNDKSFHNFDNFIGKIIQYLNSNQRRNRLNVSYESFYDGNDNIVITAQFFNKNYEFDSAANLEMTVTNKATKQSLALPFILKQTNYQVDLSGMEAGDYVFTVKTKNENFLSSGAFKILEYNVEQQFLNANVSKLQNLADNSQGTAYFIDDSSIIIDQLLKDERFATIQKSTKKVVPLINWTFLLAIIALSLSSEWFIRKYNGLI
ncbi:VWA domain-containing protein [Gelidibacter salicanalis]|uniref:VWA domain-containing protein n=1 Tax=Gelidibacter salicanalis TaxID=291193 RepID=A0A934KNN3_9FLAO|nr:VWA domain-containing protein [Gelidibacter salicanalis]MBJ7882666.1 VWA domain-containing protein [Gelidibacter salicanalis]